MHAPSVVGHVAIFTFRPFGAVSRCKVPQLPKQQQWTATNLHVCIQMAYFECTKVLESWIPNCPALKTHPRGMHGRRHTSGCPTLPELKEQGLRLMPLMLRAKSRSPLASMPGWEESSWTLYASRIWCVISLCFQISKRGLNKNSWHETLQEYDYQAHNITMTLTFLGRSYGHFNMPPRCSAHYICELFLGSEFTIPRVRKPSMGNMYMCICIVCVGAAFFTVVYIYIYMYIHIHDREICMKK